MVKTAIVMVIVAGVAYLSIKSLIKSLTGKSGCSGCSKNKGCSVKSSCDISKITKTK